MSGGVAVAGMAGATGAAAVPAGSMPAGVYDRIRVSAGAGYDVVVGRDLLAGLGERLRAAAPGADDACLVVCDGNLAGLPYIGRVCSSLKAAGFTACTATVPAGEASKSVACYGGLLDAAARAGLTRASTVVALGGGVVGDLAGFVAATYMRGCNLVQVATSLLAMVDSSVGGKTAVDLPSGKNLAGAFHQPRLVLCDLDCLATLPPTFLADGMGEVLKYGVMCDEELLGWLEEGPLSGQEGRVVARCVRIKRDVVEADEREAGARRLLNLGHTVGHAIELASGYRVPHGHAVAAGMAVMARACAAKGWCAAEDAARIERLLRAHDLPCGTRAPLTGLCAAVRHDKKRAGGELDAVILRGIGRAEVRRMPLEEFDELVRLGCTETVGTAAEDGPLLEVAAMAPVLGPSAGWVDPSAPLAGSEPVDAAVEPGVLAGAIPAISSKSAAHRMLVCAALADRPTRIACTTTSEDIERTCDCLRALGAGVERVEGGFEVRPIAARDAGAEPARRGDPAPCAPRLMCGESGSTLRFLLPVVCALGCGGSFHRSGRLPDRPVEPLRTRLIEHGCQVTPAGLEPLQAWGTLAGGVFDLPGNVSSQYVTGLLLALPLTGEGGGVRLHGIVESRPYIDLTLSAMRAFGIEVAESSEPDPGADAPATVLTVPAGARYTSPGTAVVEGDWSNAAFWLCAGALSPEPVTVTGLDLATDQGDLAVLDVLSAFGAHVRVDPGAGTATVCGTGEDGAPRPLRGTTVDARDVPDLIPVLMVVAACASGTTHVVNAARLRIKESDRLQTTAELVSSLGADVVELPDGLDVVGRGGLPLRGGAVRSHGDHRIAMAAAVAATRAAGPLAIAGAQAVAKSYPGFFADFARLGGRASLERPRASAAGVFPLAPAAGAEGGGVPAGQDSAPGVPALPRPSTFDQGRC